MTITKRESILLSVLLVIIVAAAFAWFYFIPARNDILELESSNQTMRTQVEMDRFASLQRQGEYERASENLARALDIWAEQEEGLQERIGKLDVLRRLQQYIYPFVDSLNATYTPPEQLFVGIYMARWDLSFETTYGGFLNILQSFRTGGDNRIINYSITPEFEPSEIYEGMFVIHMSGNSPFLPTDTPVSINMTVEFLGLGTDYDLITDEDEE
jgi:hypothetical protein